jgi:hypothetical protein
MALGLVVAVHASALAGNVFNGQIDNNMDAWGYYAAITGGLFPNGQTYNGDNASGGVLRYIFDDPNHPWAGGQTQQAWHRDDWFVETSGLALTMKNNGAIIFDNNGIETSSYPVNFYGNSSNPGQLTPGLYCGWEMSNNLDWVYAGYFKLNEDTEVDQIIGYFAETYQVPIDLSKPFGFNVNICSAVPGTGADAGYLMPANTGAFRGDVFSSDYVSGTFTISDTGVDRIYSGAGWSPTDNIYRLTFTLDEPIVLPAGEYFFSHDAMVPEPAMMALLALGALALLRRRR